MTQLTFTSGARRGAVLDLPPGRYIVGRSADSQLALPDAGVSGRHAAIEVTPDGGVRVTDLDSSNGTWVDGERLTDTWLVGDGAKLSFGPVGAVVHLDGARAGHAGASMSRAGRVAAGIAALLAVFAAGFGVANTLQDESTPGTATTGARDAATAAASRPKAKRPTRKQVLAQVQNATVKVSDPEQGWGSGWVMGFDKGRPLIVTNAHVVGDLPTMTISSDRLAPQAATVRGVSQCDDLAVVRADKPIPGVGKLALAGPPDVGDSLLIAGFPARQLVDQDAPYQLHRGSVASLGATAVNHEHDLVATYRNLVQVDGTINHGNSGGPLVEQSDGRVVGVATLTFVDPHTPESYGIASDRIREVVPYLAQGTSVPGMTLGFEPDRAEPRILGVASDTLRRGGVTADAGQRVVAIDHRRFDRQAFPNGLASVCDALPPLGDDKSETVTYTVRKPDGNLVQVPIGY